MAAHKHKAKTHHPHHHTPNKKEKKTNILSWILSAVILFGLLFIAANYAVSDSTMVRPENTNQQSGQEPMMISDDEKKLIDQWIQNNNLNQYGDTKDTVYLGGTPLFDEATGTYKNLYDYITERHPDRPWNN